MPENESVMAQERKTWLKGECLTMASSAIAQGLDTVTMLEDFTECQCGKPSSLVGKYILFNHLVGKSSGLRGRITTDYGDGTYVAVKIPDGEFIKVVRSDFRLYGEPPAHRDEPHNDVDYIQHPNKWSQWPLLPLINQKPGQQKIDAELGFIMAGQPTIVYLGNIYEAPANFTEIKYKSYPTVQDLVNDGWKVD